MKLFTFHFLPLRGTMHKNPLSRRFLYRRPAQNRKKFKRSVRCPFLNGTLSLLSPLR